MVTAWLSLDLASKAYEDCGLALFKAPQGQLGAALLKLSDYSLSGKPDPAPFAETLSKIALAEQASWIFIGGPQAWRADHRAEASHFPGRLCEYFCHCPGKASSPGQAFPATWTPFISFSVALFEALESRGFARLRQDDEPLQCKLALESYPTQSWKDLGMEALPSKTNSLPEMLLKRRRDLERRASLKVQGDGGISHDELQALCGGLAGAALAGLPRWEEQRYGMAPLEEAEGGGLREGWIVGAKRA